MFRKLPVVLSLAAIAAASVSVASAQQASNGNIPAFTPPPGAEFQINLYPITKFRGNPIVVTQSEPRMRRPATAESIIVTRGVWLLCSEQNYYGRCVEVSATREGIPVAIVARSIRLIGDTGPVSAAPTARAGPDAPVTPTPGLGIALPSVGNVLAGIGGPAPAPPEPVRAPPTAVVAPKVEVGGVAGTNPSLAGRAIQFYPAPAQSGLRVSACPEAPGPTPSARCVQAAADGFCVASGFRDSGWREFEVIGARAYLVNVLCKQAADSDGARDAGGVRLPFF